MSNQPIFMLNALWFKADGGAARYQHYLREAGKVMQALAIGARMHQPLTPEIALIGSWDPDLFFVVEYPGRAAFDRLIHSPEYNAIKTLRDEALEKSLLIQCSPFAIV